MKKILLLIAGIGILGISSCKKEVIENYYTVPNKTIYADRVTSDWTAYDGGKTYTATIPLFDSDNYYNEYDGILVFASYDNGSTYEQIPTTYQGISYSYAVTNSQVIIDIQTPNFDVAVTPPGSVKFKVVLIPSEE